MESNPPAGGGNAPRKMKFTPKPPPPRKPRPVAVKAEIKDDDKHDDSEAKKWLRHLNEGISRGRGAKVERKAAPSRVAFGDAVASSSIRSYGSRLQPNNGSSDVSSMRVEKEYKEPWDYYSYYPVTLPLRRPYSGDPALLDEEEFGEAAEAMTFDENLMNSAEELGLEEKNLEPSFMFIQLPPSLPLVQRTATSEGSTGESSKNLGKGCNLDKLPAGILGKMLVYRSGAVKMKLGDNLYDVSVGSNCEFAQDAVAMNTVDKQCCVLGELNKRAIVTPDVDSVLDMMEKL